MSSKFVEMELPLIDEGQVLNNINEDLSALMRQMVSYAKEHGELAFKAKGELNIKISLICTDPKSETFGVKCVNKTTLPTRPANVTTAMGATGDDEEPTLFVRNTGSGNGHPKQGVLHKKNGDPNPDLINKDTGETTE